MASQMTTHPALTVRTYTGADLLPWLADIARLRIQIFHDWPYLYDGNAIYEQRYLQTYVNVPGAMVAVCLGGTRVVGASTALPMTAETDEITAPFRAQGYDLARILYCGESVLDPRYRGLGIGVRFFEERERHARSLPGIDTMAFCGVQRAQDDPRRPPDYVPLDSFWRRRGFAPHPELRTTMRWHEIGASEETPKPMMFWMKSLSPEQSQ
jgi:GNAT superfamily N-acetyltransferase